MAVKADGMARTIDTGSSDVSVIENRSGRVRAPRAYRTAWCLRGGRERCHGGGRPKYANVDCGL